MVLWRQKLSTREIVVGFLAAGSWLIKILDSFSRLQTVQWVWEKATAMSIPAFVVNWGWLVIGVPATVFMAWSVSRTKGRVYRVSSLAPKAINETFVDSVIEGPGVLYLPNVSGQYVQTPAYDGSVTLIPFETERVSHVMGGVAIMENCQFIRPIFRNVAIMLPDSVALNAFQRVLKPVNPGSSSLVLPGTSRP